MLVLLFAGTALAASGSVTIATGQGMEVGAGRYNAGTNITAAIVANSANCYLSMQLYTDMGQSIAYTTRVSTNPTLSGTVPTEGTNPVSCFLYIVNECETYTTVSYVVA